MNGTPITLSIGQISTQAEFAAQLGVFLTHQAGVGLMPYDLKDHGEIVYESMDLPKPQLEPLIRIDGSPRQVRVRGIDIPELHESESGKKLNSPFVSNIFMLQKSMEVPLSGLMTGSLTRTMNDFSSRALDGQFKRRLELFGDMTARAFLAAHAARGADERMRAIRPVAEDIFEVARGVREADGESIANAYFYNSAILFAALEGKDCHERAADNFYLAAKSLFGLKNFVAVAILSELAAHVGQSHLNEMTLNKYRAYAANSWDKSIDEEPGGENIPLRIYRGMLGSFDLPNKSIMERLLRKASHLSLAGADPEAAAADFMRRAWYGAHRTVMADKDWAFVKDMINRAIAMWMNVGKDSATIDIAVGFATIAEDFEVEQTVG